ECDVDNGGCQHRCNENDMDKWCSCDEGFQIASDDWRKCVDIDECLGKRGVNYHVDCHNCINTNGSYTCDCDEGYELHPDGKSCIGQSSVRLAYIELNINVYFYFVFIYLFFLFFF
ncbi:hypothetical protein CAPTEDRAFT_124430, partial [Capitella teleta]